MTSIDPAAFRQLCGRFATGVTVVTACGDSGRPAGMTANSFTSVSLEPPLISVNVDHAAEMHPILAAAPDFAVNILAQNQEAVSRRFAESGGAPFAEWPWHAGPGGLPVIEGVLATLFCTRHATFEAGDHTVFVGRVTGGQAAEGLPLIYFRGGYRDVPPA